MKRSNRLNYKKVQQSLGVPQSIVRSLCIARSQGEKERIIEFITMSVIKGGEKILSNMHTPDYIEAMDKEEKMDLIKRFGSVEFTKKYYEEKNRKEIKDEN